MIMYFIAASSVALGGRSHPSVGAQHRSSTCAWISGPGEATDGSGRVCDGRGWGSDLATQGKTQGKRSTRVRIEPPTLLEHTHWSSMSGVPDEPEHYETVEWRLSERDGATELTVSEANLPSEEARDLSQRSWRMVLDGLRQLLER
ncbi:MAG: SRPBCC family protein [Actinomycetota bacterium]